MGSADGTGMGRETSSFQLGQEVIVMAHPRSVLRDWGQFGEREKHLVQTVVLQVRQSWS